MNKLKIVAVIAVCGIMCVPAFNLLTGVSNIAEFFGLYGQIQQARVSNMNTENDIASSTKKLMEMAEAEGININSVSSIYSALSKLSGISSITGKIVDIESNGQVTDICTYESGTNYATAEGIKIDIYSTDINKVVNEINKLNLAYQSININYSNNSLQVVFNTEGGVV